MAEEAAVGASLDKQRLLEAIVAQLAGELARYDRAARSAQEEATNEQSKAENKYDTRGLEASYLAHGQSRQAAEIEAAIESYRAIALRTFAPGESAAPGALVEVHGNTGRCIYFIGPGAGGREVEAGGYSVTTVTPHSPMGRQLIGKRQGESFRAESGEQLRLDRVT